MPDPGNYTITFNTDGSLSIKADCNQVGGTYTLSDSSLTITLGPSTLAFCGEASQDTIYLASLGKVSSYALEGGQLQLKFADDAGKMGFLLGGIGAMLAVPLTLLMLIIMENFEGTRTIAVLMRYTGEDKKEERQQAMQQVQGLWDKAKQTVAPQKDAPTDAKD